MTTWLVMLLAGFGTYLLRVSLVLAHDSFGMPHSLERRLHLVGPSVLAAIVVSALLVVDDRRTTPDPATLVAVVGAFVAARRTHSVAWAMVVGFPLYWVAVAVGSF